MDILFSSITIKKRNERTNKKKETGKNMGAEQSAYKPNKVLMKNMQPEERELYSQSVRSVNELHTVINEMNKTLEKQYLNMTPNEKEYIRQYYHEYQDGE